MGRCDIVQKRLWEKRERVTDLINYVEYGGVCHLSADEVEDRSAQASMTVCAENPENRAGRRRMVEKYRDVKKQIRLGSRYRLLGIENQNKMHYAMAVRIMQMDAAEYDRQLRDIRREHEEKHDLRTSEELLSRVKKEDRLKPVNTICLYYGKQPWSGARSLHELIDFAGDETLRLNVPDYPLRLVEVYHLKDLEKFQSDLRQIFGFLQCSSEKGALLEFMQENQEYFQHLDEDTYDFLAVMTGERKLSNCKKRIACEEEFDMCKAIEDLIKDSKAEGRKEGRQEGEEKLCRLFAILQETDRTEDQRRAIASVRYRRKLYRELGIG